MDNMVNSIHKSMDSTMDTLNGEVKSFLRKRQVYCLTWLNFLLLGIANVLAIIAFSTPGWAWTTEIAGIIQIAGEYYGLYGIWYVCWMDMKSSNLRVCDPWTDIKQENVPAWLPGFQAASVLALIFGLTAFSIQLACICIPTLYRKNALLISFVTVSCLAGFATVAEFTTFSVGFLNDARSCCKPEMVREITYFQLWYSFVISCISAGFYFATTIAGIWEIMVARRDYKKEDNLTANE